MLPIHIDFLTSYQQLLKLFNYKSFTSNTRHYSVTLFTKCTNKLGVFLSYCTI